MIIGPRLQKAEYHPNTVWILNIILLNTFELMIFNRKLPRSDFLRRSSDSVCFADSSHLDILQMITTIVIVIVVVDRIDMIGTIVVAVIIIII